MQHTSEERLQDITGDHIHSAIKLDHLTGVRAIAAILVLITHSADSAFHFDGVSVFHPLVACLAFLGMPIFFVLSGFVITYKYQPVFAELGWKAAKDFLVARIARLYPLYAFFILLEIHTRKSFIRTDLWTQLTHVTLTQSWFGTQFKVFAPSWSISAEWFFYLCFLFFVPKRVMFYPVMLAAFYFVWTLNLSSWEWLQYPAPYFRIGEFFLGCVAAQAFMKRPNGSNKMISLCLLAIVGLLIINVAHLLDTNTGFAGVLTMNLGFAPFVAYIIYAISSRPHPIRTFLAAPCVVFLGDISYSIYIMQFWVFHVIDATNDSYISASFRFLEYIGLTVVVAIVTNKLIEKPFANLIRQSFTTRLNRHNV